MKYISLLVLNFLITLTTFINPTMAQVRYKVIELGILGGNASYPTKINDLTQISGYSSVANQNYNAFLWEDEILTNLGTFSGGTYSLATGINNQREVVGSSNTSSGHVRAFLWQNGTMSQLSTLGGNGCNAFDINNLSQIVGGAHTEDNKEYKAVLWQGSSITDLGLLSNDITSTANAINDSSIVVGISSDDNSNVNSFIWENGNISDMGNMGGNFTWVSDINNSRIAVGWGTKTTFHSKNSEQFNEMLRGTLGHGFIWLDGNMTEVTSLGGTHSNAIAINDSGIVVGWSEDSNNIRRACIWEKDSVKDLNELLSDDLSVVLNSATGINNKGEIIATAIVNGYYRAFLLIPFRYPVFIVPGIAGTYSSSTVADIGWILERGSNPLDLQIDPLARVYNDIIETFENVGYKKDTTLFVVNYDWRLPPGPIDNNIDGKIDGLNGVSITDNQFNYAVDYLGWYIKKASDIWREMYDEDLDSIDVISHSTGGLVTRTYIQSDAYGDVYDLGNNHILPKIRNFVMIGVPNRGASKAWNPIRDNWIADIAYRMVLSKILNRGYQKVLQGFTVVGPDYNINQSTILDSLGNPSKTRFISQYVPTIRGLLATYDFIDFGNGLTNVNDDPEQRNNFLLDLNDGLDLNSAGDANKFLDSAKVMVIYGTGEETKQTVEQRTDFEFAALQSFTDYLPTNATSGVVWFNDLANQQNGDGTVPIISSAGQFQNDSRATLVSFSSGNHTSLVSSIDVQSDILNLLEIEFDNSDIKTGSSLSYNDIWNVISDPVDLLLIDGNGNRLGYSNATGAISEIQNSIWFGNNDGMGYVFGTVTEPVNLQLTGLGEDYYVMVSVEDSGRYGGVVLEGFLALGEVVNYQITLDPLSVEQITLTADDFTLAQNYPNPFNPVTTIQYSIPQRSNVKLKVYDILGNEVATLVNEEKDRGVYTVNFDASGLASGIYFYRILTREFVHTKKMVIMK